MGSNAVCDVDKYLSASDGCDALVSSGWAVTSSAKIFWEGSL